MSIKDSIPELQKEMQKSSIDGWLLYDFQGTNTLALPLLGFPKEAHLTRRFFYWIPKTGTPQKLTHQIESHILDHLPGDQHNYLSRTSFLEKLSSILKSAKTISMEYSQEIPTLSKVDGGIIDLIRSFNKIVVSSGALIQPLTSVLTDEQIASQKRAASFTSDTVDAAYQWISKNLPRTITEIDVKEFILNHFNTQHFVTNWEPIVATNIHSSLPHHEPSLTPLKKGDFLLLDLGCKELNGIYADITRVATLGRPPTKKEALIFEIVKKAQVAATEYIANTLNPLGATADQIARSLIESHGYGPFFTHRLGHSITDENHGPGANLDSLETNDLRPLLPKTCFTIEPGIYLPNEFGVRLEYDILLLSPKNLLITGGNQQNINHLSI
ncbi:M24 family metallopeptidase [Chlamydiales bacterium]|nr:M24 family metallopeptidase [Chlamydiales bacterium]